MQNDFCKLFIDCDCDKRHLVDLVMSATHGRSAGRASVSTETCELDVEDNDEFDEVRRKDAQDGFLYSRYYVDVDPIEGVNRDEYIRFLIGIIASMRKLGFVVVPACSFEAQLSGI